MGLIVRISDKDKQDKVRRALAKLAKSRKKKKRSLIDFYGALPFAYKDGLKYQQDQRNDW